MDAASDRTAPQGATTPPRSVADFEREALATMTPEALGYVEGGAGDEVTLADNVAAWRRIALRPRMLVGASACDPGVTLLGVRRPRGSAVPVVGMASVQTP